MFNYNKMTQKLGGHLVVNVTFTGATTALRDHDRHNVWRLVYKYAASVQQRQVEFLVKWPVYCAGDSSKMTKRLDEGRLLFSRTHRRTDRRQDRQDTLSNSHQV